MLHSRIVVEWKVEWKKNCASNREIGNQASKYWRKSEEGQNQCCFKSSVTPAGSGPLGSLKPTVLAAVNRDFLNCFLLPFADHASLGCCLHFPAGKDGSMTVMLRRLIGQRSESGGRWETTEPRM